MFPSASFDTATMPRKNVAPTTDNASVDRPVMVGSRHATAVFAAAIESVHAEVQRLEGLRELLEYSELEWTEQQKDISHFQAEMERVRQRHLKRLQRFRRIRNGFREIESQESSRAKIAQSELLELRSQLSDAVGMLESARDEKYLLEDLQKTELELLHVQREEAETRCGQLSKELDEACLQAMELPWIKVVARSRRL
jgi:ribosomal protein L16 Arg81 hydroxylase